MLIVNPIMLLEMILRLLLEPFLEVAARLLLWIGMYLIAFPVACILLTPIILLNALFGEGSYTDKVWSGYKGVCTGLLWAGPGGPG